MVHEGLTAAYSEKRPSDSILIGVGQCWTDMNECKKRALWIEQELDVSKCHLTN